MIVHVCTHTHTEGALATTASIPVMTVPDEAIPNTVVMEINGFTPSTVTIYNYVTPQFNGPSIQFTLENQRRFREATADAVNGYCEDNECLVSYPEARRR